MDEACSYGARVGYPLVMKIQSADIAHKTEIGGVRIGVKDEAAVKATFSELMSNARARAPEAKLDGVLMQQMISDATELIVGINNDALFGPAVMVGFGGIFAEVLRDVNFRLTPITRSEASEMVHDLLAFPILNGARGRPLADVDAVVDTLLRLSALAIDLKDEIAELDVNPLFVRSAGHGALAGDALIRLSKDN